MLARKMLSRRFTWILLGAGSLLLATAPVRANDAKGQPNFNEVDQNGDQRVQWQELRQAHDEAIARAGLSEQQVRNAFDRDEDGAFNKEEHRSFLRVLQDLQDSGAENAGQAGE